METEERRLWREARRACVEVVPDPEEKSNWFKEEEEGKPGEAVRAGELAPLFQLADVGVVAKESSIVVDAGSKEVVKGGAETEMETEARDLVWPWPSSWLIDPLLDALDLDALRP